MQRVETVRRYRRDPAVLIVGALLAVIVAAAAYEALFALGVISVSGTGAAMDTPALETPVLVAALFSMWGAALAFVVAAVPRRLAKPLARVPFLWLVPLASAALVVARAYTYDPYDFPSLTRTSQSNGSLPMFWVIAGVTTALAVFVLARRLPRVAILTTAVVLFVAASTAFIATLGH